MTMREPTLKRLERQQSEHRLVALGEYQKINVACSVQTAAAIHADGHLAVAPSSHDGAFELRARHKVGVLRYGELEIRVLPKVSVARLLYLAAFHTNDSAWQQVEALLGEVDDPLSAIAQALLFHAERALCPTPLQGYVTHELARTDLRGRVLFHRQITRHAGVVLPVELRFDEFEPGIIENRVIKAALLVVVRSVSDVECRTRVRHLLSRLDQVSPWRAGQTIPEIGFNRLNERYRPAIHLSRLVLEQRSLEFYDMQQHGTAFLFNMNKVFESYLEASLGTLIQARGGRIESQHSIALDENERVKMRPDITWWQSGRCMAVIDAKYKRATNADYPNADIYQMLAYCKRLKLQRGYLVYADLNGEEPGTCTIRNSDIQIVVTSIDIGGTLEELTDSVEQLGDLLEHGMGLSERCKKTNESSHQMISL